MDEVDYGIYGNGYHRNFCGRDINYLKIIMAKEKYSFLIGLGKTAKNSAYLLVPFGLALLASVPVEFAWIIGPVVYMLKNYYENKN